MNGNHVVLLTGASRGLGQALAHGLNRRGASLFLVARSAIQDNYVDAVTIQADLSEPDAVDGILSSFGEFLQDRNPKSVTLINNAGTLTPILPAHKCNTREFDASVRLNLVAPMAMTSGFLRLFEGKGIDRRVINISSGAASSPYAGWSSYCAGKAGLEHFTRCVGLEQRQCSTPATVIALAPGVVDTDMQSLIRGSNQDDFPAIHKFVDLKTSGDLRSAEQAAEKLIRFLETQRLETGEVYDIRDY